MALFVSRFIWIKFGGPTPRSLLAPLKVIGPASKTEPGEKITNEFDIVALPPARVPPRKRLPALSEMLPVPEIEAPASIVRDAFATESSVACAPDIVYEPVR